MGPASVAAAQQQAHDDEEEEQQQPAAAAAAAAGAAPPPAFCAFSISPERAQLLATLAELAASSGAAPQEPLKR